jgi:hypothetical protein
MLEAAVQATATAMIPRTTVGNFDNRERIVMAVTP